jgi:hypothetical protein
MTLSVACIQCSENIRADSKDALATIVMSHYAEHHHNQSRDIVKTTDTRGTPEVLKDRSVVTHPISVSDE